MEYLNHSNEITSVIAGKLLNVTRRTANRLLNKAEESGILTSDGNTKKKIYFKK